MMMYAEKTFTVGNGKQVSFSPGNLQYKASTGTWRFANRNWEVLGQNNTNISSTYDGYIDLFGYGTSYEPYLHTQTPSDYYTGDLTTTHDWGWALSEFLGEGVTNRWRTLSYDEWYFLLYTRNVNFRFAKCTLWDGNGFQGLIVFPDDFETDVSIPTLNNTNAQYSAFVINSEQEWSYDYEGKGCVFLPTSGYRSGTSVLSVYARGYYWTSSYNNNNNRAYLFGIDTNAMILGNYMPAINFHAEGQNTYFGCAVRLVKNC